MNQNNLKPLDCHVHIVGNGSSGSGCWIRLRGAKRILARFMLANFGLPVASLKGDLDRLYVERLLHLVRTSSLGQTTILAHDNVYDESGNIIEGKGSFYVPNQYVLRLGREHPEFLPVVSIHPARKDALDELDRCLEGGAVMMKCLPNCHNINVNDPRLKPFWKKMADARLPLLAHTGGELSVPVVNKAYQDPRILTQALECGVTIIAAHSATSSGVFDPNYLPVLSQMLDRYPHLYADNSALCSPLRSKHLRTCLQEKLQARMVHGSDLPIPVSGVWLWLRGLIDYGTYRTLEKIPNVLERDYQLKKALGFSPESFTRLRGLLRTSYTVRKKS